MVSAERSDIGLAAAVLMAQPANPSPATEIKARTERVSDEVNVAPSVELISSLDLHVA
jgi:hypothetical protein